mgnify:CR=1 FL=1
MQKRRSQMDRFIGKTSRSVDWERGHPKVLDNPAIYIKDKIQPAQSVSRSRRTLGSLSAHPSPSGRTPTCLCLLLSVCLSTLSLGRCRRCKHRRGKYRRGAVCRCRSGGVVESGGDDDACVGSSKSSVASGETQVDTRAGTGGRALFRLALSGPDARAGPVLDMGRCPARSCAEWRSARAAPRSAT